MSLFWILTNKNLHKLSLKCVINRNFNECSLVDVTLLRRVRRIDTLKELALTIKDKNIIKEYTFKDCTKEKIEKIVDAVWGFNPYLTPPSKLPTLVKFDSLQTIKDFITIL